jgi:imidazolonepropionase-like amidohydrolase
MVDRTLPRTAATRRLANGRAWLLLTLLALSAGVRDARAQVPGPETRGPVAVVGATLHPVSGPAIENGTLVFERGRIVALGEAVEPPTGAQRIDGRGKHVYPGFLQVGGQLGLVEINSIRATQDAVETGEFNPNVRAQVAVNPDSELIPVTRANGVLLALTMPSGGIVSGTSAVLQLDGWTWEQMTLKAPAALHVQWPPGGVERLEQMLDEARRYQQGREAGTLEEGADLRWEAMLPVLRGELPIVVATDSRVQIQSAVAFADRHRLRLVIFGGYDAVECAGLLRDRDIPVVVPAVFRLPRRRSDPFDASYTLPDRLRQAGVRYCIAGGDRFDASNLRNLPYHAATAVAYGLPRDEAIRAITLYPAQILGIADRVGSLEAGKDATLLVVDGDPLEPESRIAAAFIQGRRVDLDNRHTRLWRKYQQKYRQSAEEDSLAP